jgi:hypothetical protein
MSQPYIVIHHCILRSKSFHSIYILKEAPIKINEKLEVQI